MRGPCTCPACLLASPNRLTCVGTRGGVGRTRGPCACPACLLASPNRLTCVGTRGGVGRMRGPCACPACLLASPPRTSTKPPHPPLCHPLSLRHPTVVLDPNLTLVMKLSPLYGITMEKQSSSKSSSISMN